MRELHPDLVVLANNAYQSAAMKKRQVGALRDQLELLRPLAGKVAMIGDSPKLPKAPGTCISERDVDLGDCLQEPETGPTRIQGQFRQTVETSA